MDIKITFQKSLEPITRPEKIQRYESSELEEELAELAYLSGIYSRFKTDSRLHNQEFEKLYKRWITKAFEKKEILIAPDRAGMVTCAVEQEVGKIGLIAVAEKYQDQGWGKKLVKAAEYHCSESGAKEILIPTQEINTPACKLYESLGYIPEQRVYIYHWWKV